jgi:hypothetical protein
MFIWPSDVHYAYKTVADDYESQYFWLSWDMHEITSTPAWLNLAIGFSCENLPGVSWARPAGAIPATDIFIGPDINLKGIPIEGKFWKTFSDIASFIRIPFPSLQVYPRVKFWWLR